MPSVSENSDEFRFDGGRNAIYRKIYDENMPICLIFIVVNRFFRLRFKIGESHDV